MGVTESLVTDSGPRGESGEDTSGADSSDEELLAVLDVLGDAVSRRILVGAVDGEPTVEELARRSGVSASTVYRRLDGLNSLGLIERVTSIETDSVGYRTTMRGLYVAVDGDGISVAADDGDAVTPNEGANAVAADDGDDREDLSAAFSVVREAIEIDRFSYDRETGRVEVCFSLEDDELEAFLDSCVEQR